MMKISNGYFKHPVTGEIIKPGEMYPDFDKKATVSSGLSLRQNTENDEDKFNEADDQQKGDSQLKPLSDYTPTELRKIAKELKIEGYSKMNKDDLVHAINTIREPVLNPNTAVTDETILASDVK